jgi:hypothetical protein
LPSISFQFDVRGAAVLSFPLPSTPALAGRSYQVRALGRGPCADAGRIGSNGILLTLMP